jgi:hypothetical protein
MIAAKGRRSASLTVLIFTAACLSAGFLVAGAIRASEPKANPPPPAAAPASELAKYYGFGDMEILKMEYDLGRPIVADINRDGLNDIIVVNNAKSRIELLLQKKGFKPSEKVAAPANPDDINDLSWKEASWRFKRASYDLDVAATSLEVADVNGDGWPDLVYYAKNGLHIILQKPPAAQPHTAAANPKADKPDAGPPLPVWQEAKKIDIQEGIPVERAVACGDLNADKRIDIALLANDGVFLLYQKEDGTFAQPVRYPSGGQRPRQVHVADVDGDGRNDLVLLTGEEDYTVRVRFQADDGKLGPEVRYEVPIPAVMETISLGRTPQMILATVSAGSGRVLLYALGKGLQEATYPVLIYPLPTAGESAGDRDMTAADVDGDGILDVVASDPATAEFLLFRGRPRDFLGTPERFPGMMDMRKLCAGDLDGSGKAAIVALSVKEKLIGTSRMEKGRLSFPQSVPVVGEPEAMDLADVDGDKKLDLVYVAKDKASGKRFLRALLNVGAKDPKPGPELELADLKDKPLDVRAADVDHDGRCDVMVLCPYGPMMLVRQSEAGKFAFVTGRDVHAGLVAEVTPAAMSLAPLGPKGQPAVLLAQKTFARSLIFDAEKGWTVVDQYPPADPRSKLVAAAACPLASGGGLAVVTYDSVRGKLGILSRQADGTYRTDREIELGQFEVRKILSGNFGGPAPVSLLVCGSQQMALVPMVSRSKVLRKLAGFETQIKQARFGALAVGDLNADGAPDVALCDQATGHLEVLTFNRQAELVSATRFKVFEQPREIEPGRRPDRREAPSEPRAVLIGDVTGDGKADLILLVHDRIVIYPQD